LHEFLMPIVTLPFYMAFGIFGCLVFNIVISIFLMMVLFELCARHVGYGSAFTATALTAFTTLFLNYTYSYSLDVFGAFMLTLAYWCLVKRRYLLAGLVWGLATYARLPNAVTVFGFLVFALLESCSGKSKNNGSRSLKAYVWRAYPVLAYLTGGLPVAACFFMTNFLMFGSPLTTSYDRWLHFVNGQPVITEQSSSFSCSALENLPEVLLDKKSGLVTGAPLIVVALAFGMKNFWLKARNDAILLIVASAMLATLFSKYCNAFPGELGNRYLMPIVALCAIPLAFAVEQCVGLRGSGRDKT
jgi:hypothetical protein